MCTNITFPFPGPLTGSTYTVHQYSGSCFYNGEIGPESWNEQSDRQIDKAHTHWQGRNGHVTGTVCRAQ